jgi:hypothetical protein
VFWNGLEPDGNSSDNDGDAMSVVIDREKYTALMPLIRTTPGYVGEKVQLNKYTLKCSLALVLRVVFQRMIRILTCLFTLKMRELTRPLIWLFLMQSASFC